LGRNKRLQPYLAEAVTIEKAVAEGYGLVRIDGEVIFVEGAAPGDVADIFVYRKRRRTKYAKIQKMIEPSPHRVSPQCEHFNFCGGCKWQHLSYPEQLAFKQQQVYDQMQRIGGLTDVPMSPIVGCESVYAYRNKLEFSFSENRWILPDELDSEEELEKRALGFHIAGRYDKILHINQCHLQDDYHNEIRNFIFQQAIETDMKFYNIKEQTGTLRNLTLRCNRKGEWMVLLTTTKEENAKVGALLGALVRRFDRITSLHHAINEKSNDSIYDLDFILIDGESHLTETILGSEFIIRPKSFFQTNPDQTEKLYQLALDEVALNGNEVVYDLYSGTGTIGLFMAPKTKAVVGVESVADAVKDAEINAERNGIENATFVCGDMKDVFNPSFYDEHGNPDVIITDPPRAGMHPGVVEQLNQLKVPKLVYISCNPATQARDIKLLSEVYQVDKIQPVDMFPHTHHVENIAVLSLKDSA
jgi:23S rRNA (uracil1939-C5)-methyltransferase